MSRGPCCARKAGCALLEPWQSKRADHSRACCRPFRHNPVVTSARALRRRRRRARSASDAARADWELGRPCRQPSAHALAMLRSAGDKLTALPPTADAEDAAASLPCSDRRAGGPGLSTRARHRPAGALSAARAETHLSVTTSLWRSQAGVDSLAERGVDGAVHDCVVWRKALQKGYWRSA